MMLSHQGPEDHNKFKQLAALANTGSLTGAEWSEWKAHLENCEECQEISREYLILTTEGIPALAAAYADREPQTHWDSSEVRNGLLARIQADLRLGLKRNNDFPPLTLARFPGRFAIRQRVPAAIAACLIVAVGLGGYHLGARTHNRTIQAPAPAAEDDVKKILTEKKSVSELLAIQDRKLARLREEGAQKEQELARVRSELRVLGEHSQELLTSNSQSEGRLQALTQQRDALDTQLRDAKQAYQNVHNEIASLQAERDSALSRAASLEAKLDELTAVNRDEERRLKEAEQFLASDRDIRELMGARKLYIADVFDVDSGSRTRKPFGRVFYTQGKSLIFYAFDLDRQPGIVNASTFQVWGQRETPPGEQALPMNLGILYMDSESNRRWVMRFDDPKQLATIDAVFVTVEPHGGSHKPTSKPFLYALLRNDANHP